MIVSELIEKLKEVDQDLEVWAYPGCSCYPTQPLDPDLTPREVVDWADWPPYSRMERIKKTVIVID